MAENNNGGYNGYTPNGDKKKLGTGWKMAIIAVLALLVVSPVDLISGDAFTVVGLADDVAYMAGIIATIVSMVKGKGALDQQSTYKPPMYNDVDSNDRK